MYKEKEVRIKINDVTAFKRKLKKMGAKMTQKYSCKDHVCEPKTKHWDPHFVNLKIREQTTGDRQGVIEMSFHKVKWLDKVKITTLGFKSTLEIPKNKIEEFIKIMNWKTLATYKRTGEHYKLKGYEFTLEKIEHAGNLLEIESTSLKELKKTLELLEKEDSVIKKSVPETVLEKIGK
jgi:adenylate cyclase class IV